MLSALLFRLYLYLLVLLTTFLLIGMYIYHDQVCSSLLTLPLILFPPPSLHSWIYRTCPQLRHGGVMYLMTDLYVTRHLSLQLKLYETCRIFDYNFFSSRVYPNNSSDNVLPLHGRYAFMMVTGPSSVWSLFCITR